jgi:hypothetical protein
MNRVYGWIKLLSTWCVGLLCALAFGQAAAVSGAISTTTDVSWPSGPCLNGDTQQGTQDVVNCNHYTLKSDVWFSGLPVSAALGKGNYFFAVVVPGGQGANSTANPNECTDKNLSDQCVQPWAAGDLNADGTTIPSGDSYTNRTFSVAADGTISYSGTHNFDQPNKKIRLFPYDDTTNNGGVYILAICSLDKPLNPGKYGVPGVNPSDCKYDAFQVETGGTLPEDFADPLTVTKDANGAYNDTFSWALGKSVDKTIVKQVGGTATFTYTVTATPDGGTISAVKVTGTISVFNPNLDTSSNPLPVAIDGVTDELSDGTVCTVTGGGAQTLTQAKTDFPYECDLTNLPSGTISNTVTVNWSDQTLSDGSFLAGDSADFTFQSISFTETDIDKCITVTDPNAATTSPPNPTGLLGQACVGGNLTFTYSITVNVPAHGCQSYTNTATFTGNDTGTPGSSNTIVVQVCGPAQTGALTIGFWKGPNGQALITNYCQAGALGTYLKGLGGGSGPFANAPSTCSGLASYVSGILTGANAQNMNNMLKAQMLGTALDVWFSGAGWTSTTLNKIKPPSNFLSHNNLGTFNMDTTAVCPMVDSLSTGTATCTNNKPSTDAVKAGAVPSSPMSMQAILDFASTVSNPFNGSTSNSIWYGGNRTNEEILKNIFDQFNNQLAFGSF